MPSNFGRVWGGYPVAQNPWALELEAALGVPVLGFEEPVDGPALRPWSADRFLPASKSDSGAIVGVGTDNTTLKLTSARLGAGRFSTVVLGFLHPPECPKPLLVAVKCPKIGYYLHFADDLSEAQENAREDAETEFIAANCTGQALAATLLMVTDDISYTVLPPVQGSMADLKEELAEANQCESYVTHILPHVVSSLTKMHCVECSHSDLKPQNIGVCDEWASLFDFTLARRPFVGTESGSCYGTQWCSAPETLAVKSNETVLLQYADIFSLGMVSLTQATGSLGDTLYQKLELTTYSRTAAHRGDWRRWYRDAYASWYEGTGFGAAGYGHLPDSGARGQELQNLLEACLNNVTNLAMRDTMVLMLHQDPRERPEANRLLDILPRLVRDENLGLFHLLSDISTRSAKHFAQQLCGQDRGC